MVTKIFVKLSEDDVVRASIDPRAIVSLEAAAGSGKSYVFRDSLNSSKVNQLFTNREFWNVETHKDCLYVNEEINYVFHKEWKALLVNFDWKVGRRQKYTDDEHRTLCKMLLKLPFAIKTLMNDEIDWIVPVGYYPIHIMPYHSKRYVITEKFDSNLDDLRMQAREVNLKYLTRRYKANERIRVKGYFADILDLPIGELIGGVK